MKKALMIMDMQIMPFIWKQYGGKQIYKEEELISKINELIEKARNSKTPIYYIMYTEQGDSMRVEGEPMWQVHPELNLQREDQMIIKYHADSFLETDLEKRLKTDEIEVITLCGIQTEFCIDTTVKTAYSKGYKVELMQDGHSTYDSELLTAEQIINHHNMILQQFADIRLGEEIEF